MSAEPLPIRRALISVSNKHGLVELGQALARHGVEILSTGGSARALKAAGIPVVEVADHTGSPEMLGGRVKTLHPRIHGGILAVAGRDDSELQQHDIEAIDLVVVNLYPFAETIARPGCTETDAIEHIDIGGPTLLRGAAKNHQRVTVLCDPADYPLVIDALPVAPTLSERRRLALAAFEHTRDYDAAISRWLASSCSQTDAAMPERLDLHLKRRQALRYGENPHQQAALYVESGRPVLGLAGHRLLQGKALSYNNLLDADAAWRTVRDFGEHCGCVIVKHGNPCGAALGTDPAQAFARSLDGDPTSAFGGIVAFNRPVDEHAAELIAKRFFEVVTAPEFTPGAQAALSARSALRVLVPADSPPSALELKAIDGGWLAQTPDRISEQRNDFEVVTRRSPDEAEWRDLELAWKVAAVVRSNAIVLVRDGATIGIGAGQMSRVDASRIAVSKAREHCGGAQGAVLASDAFFPFADGLIAAAEAGVRAVIQPGGSKRDAEVIACADEHGLAMVFTRRRHFRH